MNEYGVEPPKGFCRETCTWVVRYGPPAPIFWVMNNDTMVFEAKDSGILTEVEHGEGCRCVREEKEEEWDWPGWVEQ